MKYRWSPIIGARLSEQKNGLLFKGGTTPRDEQSGTQEAAFMGLHICDQTFSGGTLSATITFLKQISPASCCDFVINYDPITRDVVDVGIPPFTYPLFSARAYRNSKWEYIASVGNREGTLLPGVPIHLEVNVVGSQLTVTHDGVVAMRTQLPTQYPQSQVGLFFIGHNDILVSDFHVVSRKPRAFVVMQFSSPYNDVYMEVIKQVCDEMNIEVLRVDEAYGPGLIISDITRSILESTFVIADVSPINANVFYEVGYAHGLNKPTILIAEKTTKLPFDVSPFRTLFYENSIAGKPRLEKGLREYIAAVLKERTQPIV